MLCNAFRMALAQVKNYDQQLIVVIVITMIMTWLMTDLFMFCHFVFFMLLIDF